MWKKSSTGITPGKYLPDLDAIGGWDGVARGTGYVGKSPNVRNGRLISCPDPGASPCPGADAGPSPCLSVIPNASKAVVCTGGVVLLVFVSLTIQS